ncbi:MAG: DUF692 family protein [Pseudomonadota bacterium]|nr:DUF692 family protein [Pseudomonadota bacterium]
MGDFLERVRALPKLGIGVSTEYGARDAPGALDPVALRTAHPRWGSFLEVGVEVAKGLDADALAWAGRGWPTTYHFLDVNLDDPADLDPRWLDGVRALVDVLHPAWLCGDAGLWHFGGRERGHMLLLPPILTDASARAMGEGIRALRAATGREVLPENPPGVAFVGDLHLLDFFARLAEAADTGLLLDLSHLAIYQHLHGHDPLDGLDGFPAERVVEVHLAGGVEREVGGFRFIEDEHGTAVRPEAWRILEALLPRMPNLKAVVLECERNPLAEVAPLFADLERRLGGWAPGVPG